MKNLRLYFLAVFMTLAFGSKSQENEEIKTKKAVLIVHGGAGTILKENMSQEKEDEITEAIGKALTSGFKLIKRGKSSNDAIVEAIKILENDPNFNSGKGSVLNEKGNVEMDASIMNGKDLNAGAVAAVHRIKNPILAARAVMEKSEHVLLSGEGAEIFAESQNIEFEEPEYFITDAQRKSWENAKQKLNSSGMDLHYETEKKMGTVGAVALDENGNISAGTSTGGMMMKKFGRIGDSPIIGAGTYANNKTCGVSCTGHGEYFIRYSVAYRLSAMMELGNKNMSEAADEIINKTLKDINALGGLIALDAKGNYTFAFNTPGMYRGVIFEDGTMQIEFYK